jgi:peptidoglycan hydrolase-like protein with peptidoglycan-binding domain
MTRTLSALQRNLVTLATAFAVSLLAVLFILPNLVNAAMLTQTLDLNDSNGDVTSLQTYLATNAALYPSGLVTGFFGPLTQAGVQRFQTAQGIVTSGTPETTGYGRVGPTTLARINSLMGGNSGSNISWDTVPVLSAHTIQVTNTTATFVWNTNELTRGEVYWSISPLQADESTGPRQQPYVSGTLALDAGGSQTNHTVTVSNLQANTLYYYLIRGIDSVGNTTMTWPSTFRTNN